MKKVGCMPEQEDVKSYVETLPELIDMTKGLGGYLSHRVVAKSTGKIPHFSP
jgi:hypothetical protein